MSRKATIIFGSEAVQSLLISLLRNGPSAAPKQWPPWRLLQTGLVTASGPKKRLTLSLNEHHPAAASVRKVLAELGGLPLTPPEPTIEGHSGLEIDPLRPLGHASGVTFRILIAVSHSADGLTVKQLKMRLPGSLSAVPVVLSSLVNDRVLNKTETGRYIISDGVPATLQKLLAELGYLLAPRDARVARALCDVEPKPAGHLRAQDGAPRLFGADLRLRNLMALAKHGPLHMSDLRWITGNLGMKSEGADNAPFGRGGLVRVWNTDKGEAAGLDPAYPAAPELKALLLKLEESYPLPPFTRLKPVPTLPALQPWNGDKLELFGSAIRTSILMSIGVLDWTFEALCVTTAIGHHRQNVKKSLKQLEKEGVVVSSRDRRPGFDVRAVTLADAIPARSELRALINACLTVWPDYASAVDGAMQRLAPRTKEHLYSRRLQERDPWETGVPGNDIRSLTLQKRKAAALTDYFTVAKNLGYSPTSSGLNAVNSALNKRIRASWDSFPTFCEQNGVVPHYTHRTRQIIAARPMQLKLPSKKATERVEAALETAFQRECVVRYRRLVEPNNHAPTAYDLNKVDSNLYRSIRRAFGTFAKFRSAANLEPGMVRRFSEPNPILRERCIREYAELSARLGKQPNAATLQRNNHYLYKQIAVQWGTFTEFCAANGVQPSRQRRSTGAGDAAWQERCKAEYADITLKLGYAPSSRQLQDCSNGLYKRIRKLWGGFGAFRAEVGVPARTRSISTARERLVAIRYRDARMLGDKERKSIVA
jgi:hypothetical protein